MGNTAEKMETISRTSYCTSVDALPSTSHTFLSVCLQIYLLQCSYLYSAPLDTSYCTTVRVQKTPSFPGHTFLSVSLQVYLLQCSYSPTCTFPPNLILSLHVIVHHIVKSSGGRFRNLFRPQSIPPSSVPPQTTSNPFTPTRTTGRARPPQRDVWSRHSPPSLQPVEES